MAVRDIVQAAAGNVGNPNAWDISKAYYDVGSYAWDISTAFYAQNFKSVLAQDDTPQDIFFKPDGTKMYIIGTPTSVHEYTLSTPWLVSSASFTQSLAVNAQELFPSGLFFKPDGTKMYICGANGDEVNEYDLSTPWNISTASALQNFSVSAQEINPTALFFNPDGTKMYLLGQTSDAVNEYSLSTAWDISTASYVQNFSVLTQEGTPQALFFKPDGTTMYVMGTLGDDINEYTLSTPWDISTSTYVQVFYVGTQDNSPMGLHFKPDGSSFYIVGSTSDTVYQYTIGGFNIVVDSVNPTDLFFKPDGTKMYVINASYVNEFDLSTAWDITTASYLQRFLFSGQETAGSAVSFKPDGTKMYVLGTTGDDVNEYNLLTAWDVSSASYVQNFSVAAQEITPFGLFFKPDGTKMYVAGATGDDINEYSLSSAWNISTASYVQNFSVAVQEGAPTALHFKPDGTKMYVLGQVSDAVHEYSLSSAWDISTASYLQNFSVATQDTSPQSIFFRDNGEQFFVAGQSKDKIFSYSISPI